MIRPPFMARVAAGVAVTAYEETLKLPGTAVALPMTTVGQLLQTTMRVQQVLTGLAIKGDQLFELLGAPPPEQPEWAVFDEDVTPADGDTARTAPRGTGDAGATPGRFALYSTPPPEAGAPATHPRTGSGDAASSDGAAVPVAKAAQPKAPAAQTSTPKANTPKTSGTETPAAKKTAAKTAPAKKTAAKKVPAKKVPAKKVPAKKVPAKKTAKPAGTKASSGTVPEIVDYLDYDSLTLAQLRARLRTLSVEDLTTLLDYENTHAARPPFVTMLTNRIDTAGRK